MISRRRKKRERKKGKTSHLAVAALPAVAIVVVFVPQATHLLLLLEARTEQEAHGLVETKRDCFLVCFLFFVFALLREESDFLAERRRQATKLSRFVSLCFPLSRSLSLSLSLARARSGLDHSIAFALSFSFSLSLSALFSLSLSLPLRCKKKINRRKATPHTSVLPSLLPTSLPTSSPSSSPAAARRQTTASCR